MKKFIFKITCVCLFALFFLSCAKQAEKPELAGTVWKCDSFTHYKGDHYSDGEEAVLEFYNNSAGKMYHDTGRTNYRINANFSCVLYEGIDGAFIRIDVNGGELDLYGYFSDNTLNIREYDKYYDISGRFSFVKQ